MRGKVFTLASVALLSCRAVLGIEELDDQATDGGTADSGADSSTADSARTDAATDAADAQATQCTPGAGCNVCCRKPLEQSKALPTVENIAKAAGCICGSGACQTECASSICGGGGMPDPSCINCLDDALIKAQPQSCGKALSDCSQNADCKPLGDCLKGCKN